jgi:hypothetical protein
MALLVCGAAKPSSGGGRYSLAAHAGFLISSVATVIALRGEKLCISCVSSGEQKNLFSLKTISISTAKRE